MIKYLVSLALLLFALDAQTTSEKNAGMDFFKLIGYVKVQGEEIQFETHFGGDTALEFTTSRERPDAIYDLANDSWICETFKKVIALPDCEMWAKKSSELTMESIRKSTDKEAIEFTNSLIKPNFVVELKNEVLTISNSHLTYILSAPINVDPKRKDRFFKYDKLNAYRKAMIQKQVPPFAQIRVDEEVLKTGKFFSELSVQIKPPKQDIKFILKFEIKDLSADEIDNFGVALKTKYE